MSFLLLTLSHGDVCVSTFVGCLDNCDGLQEICSGRNVRVYRDIGTAVQRGHRVHTIIQEEGSLLGGLLLRIVVAELSCWQQGVPIVEMYCPEVDNNIKDAGRDCSAGRSK